MRKAKVCLKLELFGGIRPLLFNHCDQFLREDKYQFELWSSVREWLIL